MADINIEGLIRTKNGVFVFRSNPHGSGFVAWDIYDLGSSICDRATCHKWTTLPKGEVVLFDLDCPPRTVSYLPCLL